MSYPVEIDKNIVLTPMLARTSGGIIVAVMLEAAIYRFVKTTQLFLTPEKNLTGAIAVDLIPYFAPSLASVLLNATRPIFAAL